VENQGVLTMKELTRDISLIKARMEALFKGKLTLKEASKYAAMDIDIAKDVHNYLTRPYERR